MKQTKFQRFLSLTLCLVLIAAMALMIVGCDKKEEDDGVEKTFTFIVVDAEGESTTFTVTTTKTNVGAALQEEGLIEGEESEYGLYVKKVNGIRADYTLDGAYWAFYEGDQMASKGVDATEIENGATYKFVYTKA
ncbi:MAG: DUF4430 domain-containing protein [Clostridia bacterium]|nr:DUF4430 domain-containing protein [Clostridia bacterium]